MKQSEFDMDHGAYGWNKSEKGSESPLTDKQRIEKEADEYTSPDDHAHRGYIAGATAERERYEKLHEFVLASEQFSASQMKAYHEKIAKLINEKAELQQQLKEERNKAIDFYKWMLRNGWEEHSSGRYYFKLEYPSQWPPRQSNCAVEAELLTMWNESLKSDSK